MALTICPHPRNVKPCDEETKTVPYHFCDLVYPCHFDWDLSHCSIQSNDH